jgi:hypothetical protein
MNKLKQYKTQIFNAITIFLIVTFVIFPGLTIANTFFNILAGISALLLLVWGGIALYDYVRSSNGNPYPSPVDETITQSGKTELDSVSKPKAKRKPKVAKPEYPLEPHAKAVKRVSKAIKTK